MAGPGQAQTQNMNQFEAYFQRADLDRDGRISGAEAVAFFQASNLPQPVLAQVANKGSELLSIPQIWTYADHNKAGFLGRQEFYNALKLVTVAQSKHELTPDIVKVALHGPASVKIPAPQINLAALSGPQSNIRAGSPVPPLTSVTSAPPQSTGVRGPEGFSSQQSQFMRPPLSPSPGTVLQSQQVVAQVGTMAAPLPSSSDWLGGRTSSSASGVTSQFPDRGIGSMTGVVVSGSAPSTQPRPQTTILLKQPVSSQPNTTPSNQVAPKDSRALAATGNGFASDSLFGDFFSMTSSQSTQDSLGLTSSVSSLTVSTPTGPQSAVKPAPLNPLQSSFTQQPLGVQHQQNQVAVKANQRVQTSSALPVGPANVVSGQSRIPWPRMTQSDVQKYSKVFFQVDTDRDGKITGEQARNLFLSWRLPREILKQVWDLSDQDNDGMLSLREFCISLYLIERSREGRPLPSGLPTTILDETLLPSTAMAYGNASWRPTGFQQPQITKNERPVTSVGGGKPPRPPQLEEPPPSSQPKPKVPVLEKHLVEQLSTEEQNTLNSKFQEATDAEKKVTELEKEILDAKEKIQFYYAKTQELILYKSRCDNRLNEITERVSTDKREVESLSEKYEEKYKQAGDVASKLTIEEATFRDIQDKKMELYRAIVKLDQDGSADKIQDHFNHVQLNLEELVKVLNERCKTYGLRGKPTSLLELPFGWQPGIHEGAADWDEDWDKFEDEGFTFVKELTLDVQNVIAPPKPKTSSIRDKASSTYDSKITESSSKDNVKAENLPDDEKRIPEDEQANAQGEEQSAGSPPDSPARQNVVESPPKEYQDSQSRKDVSFDGSPRETQSEREGAESVLSGNKAFGEPVSGAFDTQYDTDAAWDFDSISIKDEDPGRHVENSFFGSDDWGLNPIKTGTTRDNSYSKQSPFFDSVPSTPNAYAKLSPFLDSVPSTPLYNSGSSPRADNVFQRKSPFSFADSVPSTPMFSGNSPRRSREGTQEHSFDSFSRFDSFNMNDSGPFMSRESLTRFDSMRSTRDSDYDQGFVSTRESMTRFDSFRSTADSEYNHGLFPPRESLTRFDSIRSTKDFDHGYGFPSFDAADPFGSSEPFKTSLASQTPRRDSDSWKAL